MKLPAPLTIIKETYDEAMEDRILRLSAAMAYYAIFSIGPLLVLTIGLAGVIMGEDQVRAEITHQLQGMVGEKSAKAVESLMAARKDGQSLWATVVGGVALLLGAAGVFGQLQDALNTIWEVKTKPGVGIWGFIRARFLSISMVLGIGFLLLISMVLSAVVSAMAGYIGDLVGLPGIVAQVFNEGVSLVVITILFALIFKVLPDVRIPWRDVWVGAAVTAILFTAGKFLLGLYLARASTQSAYGAGTAFVLVLLYVYYSSLILFFGAEFTQVYARRRGSPVRPKAYAVPVTEEERAKEGMPRSPSPSRPKGAAGPAHIPKPAYAHGQTPFKGQSMESSHKPLAKRNPRRLLAPGEQIRSQPWSFVSLALMTGFAAGFLLKFKTVRRALSIYRKVSALK